MKKAIDAMKKRISDRSYAVFGFGLVVAVALSCFTAFSIKSVTVTVDGAPKTYLTTKTTVAELLAEAGVSAAAQDWLSVPAGSKLYDVRAVELIHARRILATVGGEAETIWSVEPTVGEALAAHGIELGPEDRVEGAAPADPVKDGMSLRVVFVTEKTVEADEEVPFGTILKNNNFLAYGTENVVVPGVNGSRHVKYAIRYEDGVEVSRRELEQRVLTAAVDQVVERGTILAYDATRGIHFEYTAVYDMLGTAYYCDNNIGITYTGEMVRKGIVAVDPNVIPLGSLVYVEVPGGEDYGYALAADIGGAIVGMRIDVYLESLEAAIWWGLTDVRVYVLK